MAFGDSLTEGEASGTLRMFPLHDPGTPGTFTSYPARLLALLTARYTAQHFDVFNAGIGGSSALTDAPRFAEYLEIYTPEVVILLHGVNDLNGKVAFQTIIEAIELMIEEAKKRNVELLLSTLPAQRPDGKRAYADELIEPFNEELRKSALDMGVPLVDIHPYITVDMLTPDGLHIMPTGNQKLAEVYFDALKARYEEAAATGTRLP